MFTVSDTTINKLAELNGGRVLTNEDELLKLVNEALSLAVDGAIVQLEPEDAQALRDHFEDFNYGSYDEYISDTVVEALHMFLWGSTRGRLAYR